MEYTEIWCDNVQWPEEKHRVYLGMNREQADTKISSMGSCENLPLFDAFLIRITT